jgi:hypothetical protein
MRRLWLAAALLLPVARMDDGCIAPQIPPSLPISADMRTTLNALNLSMREEVIWSNSGSGPCPPVAAVSSGLARMCNYEAIVRFNVQPCLDGHASMTLVLQDYPSNHTGMGLSDRKMRGDMFPQCEDAYRAIVSGTRCRLLLVRQWIEPTSTHLMCSHHMANSDRRASRLGGQEVAKYRERHFGRVAIQTLAIGRAYEWARLHHPAARAFARGRTDSIWGVWTHEGMLSPNRSAALAPFNPSSPALAPRAPSRLAQPGDQTRSHADADEGAPVPLVVLDSNAYSEYDALTGARFSGDMYAFMAARLAPSYFEAWRVFAKVDCTAVCYAGNGSAACHLYQPLISGCSGEVALNAYLCNSLGGSNATHLSPTRGTAAAAAGTPAGTAGAPPSFRTSGAPEAQRDRPIWLRVTKQPFIILKPLNRTHVYPRGGKRKAISAEQMALKLEGRRQQRWATCAPACLFKPRVFPNILGLEKARAPLRRGERELEAERGTCWAGDYSTDRCALVARWRDYRTQLERAGVASASVRSELAELS